MGRVDVGSVIGKKMKSSMEKVGSGLAMLDLCLGNSLEHTSQNPTHIAFICCAELVIVAKVGHEVKMRNFTLQEE